MTPEERAAAVMLDRCGERPTDPERVWYIHTQAAIAEAIRQAEREAEDRLIEQAKYFSGRVGAWLESWLYQVHRGNEEVPHA